VFPSQPQYYVKRPPMVTSQPLIHRHPDPEPSQHLPKELLLHLRSPHIKTSCEFWHFGASFPHLDFQRSESRNSSPMTTCNRIVISVTWNVRARNREMTSDHSWYKLETTLCQNHPSLSDAVFSIWQKKPNLLGFPSHLSDDQSIRWSNCQMINLICQSISSTSSSLPTINNPRKTQLDQLSLPSCQIMAQIWTQTDFGILCQKQLRLVTTKSNPVYCPEEPLWYWVGMVHTMSSETSSSPQIHHRRNSRPKTVRLQRCNDTK